MGPPGVGATCAVIGFTECIVKYLLKYFHLLFQEKKQNNERSGELQLDTHQILPKLGMFTDTTFLAGHYAVALSATSTGGTVSNLSS